MKGLPDVCSRSENDGHLELALQVPADCPWFEGHFPGQPILPGVVQIGWAAWFVSRWIGCDIPPTLLKRIKFKHPIRPQARLTLRLDSKTDGIAFEFLLHDADALVSASSGVFASPDDSA